jgi:ABC-type multidrug transport system ATPase subunit
VLILDEPTASVDSKTEGLILDALDRLMVGRTTFVVAHRLSTLRDVDSIIVLDRGRVVERGTHDELLASGGLYAQFHAAQRGAHPARLESPGATARRSAARVGHLEAAIPDAGRVDAARLLLADARLLLGECSPESLEELAARRSEGDPEDRVAAALAAYALAACDQALRDEAVDEADGDGAKSLLERVRDLPTRLGGGPS